MSVFDLHNNIFGVNALDSGAVTTGVTNGNIIDTAAYEALEFVVQSGVITDGSFVLSLEDGEDSGLSDAAAVDAELTLGSVEATFADTDDQAVKRLGYIGKKRYVRLVVTATAATTGGIFSSAALLASPHHAPTAAN